MKNTISKQVQVMLPVAVDHPFDYLVPNSMSLVEGDFVTVPFGSKTLKGVVWGKGSGNVDISKMKLIKAKSDIPPMKKNLKQFIEWVANYSMSPLGNVVAMASSVPAALNPPKTEVGYKLGNIKNVKPTKTQIRVFELLEDGVIRLASDISAEAKVSRTVITGLIKKGLLQEVPMPPPSLHIPKIVENKLSLSKTQEKSAEILRKKVKDGGYSATLLDGVTGSGKTEVYFEAIREALKEGGQVLIMLPEIILTTQLMDRFKRRFGFTPIQWHSALTPKQRRENWRAIAKGEAPLVIGARSGLFLPYNNLKLIVVDEEHESAFKQEEGVVYHARDMALVRASMRKIPVILSSASPSLETVYNVQHHKIDEIRLSERHGYAIMPDIEAVDMREEKLDASHFLSAHLKDEMAKTVDKGLLVLLYLNRRGYAPLTLCRTCGFRFQCPDCTSWLVEHKKSPSMQCHHCGFTMRKPVCCPKCEAENSFTPCGPGVERLEEEVSEFMPNARIIAMTSDTIKNPRIAKESIRSIEAGQVDVIIGTQMVAKGHHFRRLTLVGVVDADLGLEGGDLRAAERSYQLLHQVAGRAGREELRGRAIIQTYNPDNDVMQALLSGERDEFLRREMHRREVAKMPPVTRMAAMIISGKNEGDTAKLAKKLVAYAPNVKGVRILGPAPAPLFMLRGKFRYRILIIARKNIQIQKMISHWLARVTIPSSLRVKIDIDPYSFI